MAQTIRLVNTIKRELKRRAIGYRALAEELGVSESTVKQMFASGNLSLRRLDAICDVLALDFGDLVQLADEEGRGLERLSVEQEERLVGDPVLLLVAYCVVNHWSFGEIIERYAISETDCITRLAQLDRMRVAELLPGNRIRPLVGTNFTWQPDGPIEQYFRREVQGQFFDSRFDNEGALRLVYSGDISSATAAQLNSRLLAVGQLFEDLARDDRKVPSAQKRGTTMVLAMRHWQFGAFLKLQRLDNDVGSLSKNGKT